jgi:hypothetical protein
MFTLRPRRAPFWFVVLVSVGAALALRQVESYFPLVSGRPLDDGRPALAFWVFLVAVAEVVWKGAEVAAKIALHILQYSVHLLWRFATLIAKGVGQLGTYAWKGLRQAWQLLRLTYSHVLKPAWKFVWKWVDKTERWLSRTFGPLVKRLRWLRDWVLKFYATYVRPILDMIDVTRRALRVLASLGVEWARALDRQLAELEARIERPFRLVLAKLNEVINIVNRVVTADGLFQRLAYIRTLERDMRFVKNELANAFHRPATAQELERATAKDKELTPAQHISEARAVARRRDNPYASRIDEEVTDVRRMLRQLRA